MNLVHTATGYASNDIDLGSWVQNHWEHRVYCLKKIDAKKLT